MNFSTKMDQRGSENEPFAKRRKSNSECDGNETVALDQEQTPDIFKLDLDCFQEVFDYLGLTELEAIAGTCKWLHEVAGHCYRRNYSSRRAAFAPLDMIVSRGRKFVNLIQFARYAYIDEQNGFQTFLNYQSKCLQLTSLDLDRIKITKSHLDGMKEVLTKLNFMYLDDCEIGENLHEILALTPNLKCLNITNSNAGSEWLVRKYPTLERFEFISPKNESVISFLELNSNIRTFGTTVKNIWENRELFKKSNLVLDDLAVLTSYTEKSEITSTFELRCQLLNELHELGLYKRLKVYGHINQKMVGHMTSLNALVKVYKNTIENISLSTLTNLEEIHLRCSDSVEDFIAIANNITNLERIYFKKARISHIMPLISQAPKLKEIHNDFLFLKNDTNVRIDLSSTIIILNNERKKLPNAKKVTIYISDDVYLYVKWRKQQTDIGMIKLKRHKSIREQHDFALAM